MHAEYEFRNPQSVKRGQLPAIDQASPRSRPHSKNKPVREAIKRIIGSRARFCGNATGLGIYQVNPQTRN